MKSEETPPNARQYIETLLSASRYTFTTEEVRAALSLSAPALKVSLYRLAHKKLIASPQRGFYVIVPPEYRSLGCLPAEQFVPSLMNALELPYYAGLLTAAQYHGAAHQRPQEFQVMVGKSRRRIVCGRVRVAFFVRKNLRSVPVKPFNTPRGTLNVSTPEATALDLVGYYDRAGGLNQVATVLAELAERIDPDKLVIAAAAAPLPWAQRLGFLLEHVGGAGTSAAPTTWVRARAHESTLLLPKAARKKATRDEDWKLYVNADVEPDL